MIESVDKESSQFPKELFYLSQLVPDYENLPNISLSTLGLTSPINWWVAGGCLRSIISKESPLDIDVFSSRPSDAEKYLHNTAMTGTKFPNNQLYLNPRITNTNQQVTNFDSPLGKIQLVKSIEYDDPVSCISDFDFTCCCAAYDGKKFYHHERFYSDCLQKKLVLVNPDRIEKSVGTMYRVLKYIKKGFTIDRKEFTKLQQNIQREKVDWSRFKSYHFDYDIKEDLTNKTDSSVIDFTDLKKVS